MPGPIRLPLTAARVGLFRLAQDVLSGEVDRAALTHRGWPEELLLVRASTVAALEAEVATLRARVGPDPRPLLGMATIDESVDDVVGAIRRDAAAAADALALEYAGPALRPRNVAERARETHRRRGTRGTK